ncbi:MAG: hypothetical protein NZ805_02445 [Armatimonadetes bacterium]|nr:hypothetical protein [Armatimonadota bacterium]MDW8028172.1 hypothetical protein [Armatimonadota bacterium]
MPRMFVEVEWDAMTKQTVFDWANSKPKRISPMVTFNRSFKRVSACFRYCFQTPQSLTPPCEHLPKTIRQIWQQIWNDERCKNLSLIID